MRSRLRGLGLGTDKTDEAHQVLLTRWQKVDSKASEWLRTGTPPTPDLEDVRVRFLIFVSPFSEDAHLSVGSQLQATQAVPRRSLLTVYNVNGPNIALMRELARVLEADPPAETPARLERAATSQAAPCRATPDGTGSAKPEKIPLSEFEFLYPSPAVENQAAKAIQVGFTILSDGGVTNLKLMTPVAGYQLETAALGAASLLLFTPGRVGTACVQTWGSITVNYRLERTP